MNGDYTLLYNKTTKYLRRNHKNQAPSLNLELRLEWRFQRIRKRTEFWDFLFIIVCWGFDFGQGLNKSSKEFITESKIYQNTLIHIWTFRHVKIDFQMTQPNLRSVCGSWRKLVIFPHEIFEAVTLVLGVRCRGRLSSRRATRDGLHIFVLHAPFDNFFVQHLSPPRGPLWWSSRSRTQKF